MTRQSWSMLKPKVKEEEDLSSTSLGAIDTSFLICYSFGFFISGVLGDTYNPKLLLLITLFGVSFLIFLLAFCTLYYSVSLSFYVVVFSFNGLI